MNSLYAYVTFYNVPVQEVLVIAAFSRIQYRDDIHGKPLIPKRLPDLIVDYPFQSRNQFGGQIPEFIARNVG